MLSAEADNTLRDLHNYSYDTKAEFNNCFIIHSKEFLLLKHSSNKLTCIDDKFIVDS